MTLIRNSNCRLSVNIYSLNVKNRQSIQQRSFPENRFNSLWSPQRPSANVGINHLNFKLHASFILRFFRV